MTRATNLYKHEAYKTWADRKAAADDVIVDTPDPVTSFVAVDSGATSMDLTWVNPVANAGLLAQIERAAAGGTPGTNGASTAVACTFTDVGDLVGAVAHGFQNGDRVVFDTVVTTTGIVADTVYYFVVNKTNDNFQVEASPGGGVLPLTTDGTGTVYKPIVTLVDTGDLVHKVAHGYAANTRVMFGTIVSTTGITAGTSYYVKSPTADSFQISLTPGGAAVTLTTNGLAPLYLPTFDYAVIDIVDADDEAYADTGLTTNTEYQYRLAVLAQTPQPAATRAVAYDKTD